MTEITAAKRSTRAALVVAMRPRHWVKNVFVFAPLVFAGQLTEAGPVFRTLAAFAVFCALSSAVYLVNDITDREADRLHPVKRRRPIASGELTVAAASVAALGLAGAALSAAFALGGALAAISCTYLLMNLAYSIVLKRIVIVDVMFVAAGFLVRAWAGATAIDVELSDWLVLCTGLLALFLGFVKRRQEIASHGGATNQRPILREYSLPFLDQMIAIVTSCTVLAYALYAFSPEVAHKLGTRHLGLTIPFVIFGIFRYLYLVHQRGEGENPTQLVMTDGTLLVNVMLWGVATVIALYLWR